MLPSVGSPSLVLGMSFDFPFEYATIADLGILFYPIVQLEIKTTTGWRSFDFLVDTGADVTTVPISLLSILGISKQNLPQSSTLGVGGFAVTTWEFRLPIKLGKLVKEVRASAVDSHRDGMPLLLGRKDVFEDTWSLVIDSQKHITRILFNS